MGKKRRGSIDIKELNTRIGKWQINREVKKVENKESEDGLLNNEGKKLLNFCEEVGGEINVITKEDWVRRTIM